MPDGQRTEVSVPATARAEATAPADDRSDATLTISDLEGDWIAVAAQSGQVALDVERDPIGIRFVEGVALFVGPHSGCIGASGPMEVVDGDRLRWPEGATSGGEEWVEMPEIVRLASEIAQLASEFELTSSEITIASDRGSIMFERGQPPDVDIPVADGFLVSARLVELERELTADEVDLLEQQGQLVIAVNGSSLVVARDSPSLSCAVVQGIVTNEADGVIAVDEASFFEPCGTGLDYVLDLQLDSSADPATVTLKFDS